MRITILGCGSSAGVPLATGHWGSCDPEDPRNRRTRCSIALHFFDGSSERTWLIDTSPDLRYQCLREGITRIDGVLYTHNHFDHVGGIEDLRPFAFWQKSALTIWCDEKTLTDFHHRYRYAFFDEHTSFLKGSILTSPWSLGPYDVRPFIQNHRYSTTLGFRFPSWAYSTDVWDLDNGAEDYLQGLDLWLVDCLSRTPNQTHMHLEKTLYWIERLKPRQAILIHMGYEMDYQTLIQELPEHIRPAYDGMVIDIA